MKPIRTETKKADAVAGDALEKGREREKQRAPLKPLPDPYAEPMALEAPYNHRGRLAEVQWAQQEADALLDEENLSFLDVCTECGAPWKPGFGLNHFVSCKWFRKSP